MADILIVDDEVSICTAFSRFLTADGHRPRAASSGEEALRQIAERTPDLVILDIRLPGISGLDVLKQIQRSYPSLPVIIITAHGLMENAVEAMQHGAYEYLVKPVDLGKAREVIARALKAAGSSGEVEQYRTVEHAGRRLLVGPSDAMQEIYKRIGMAGLSEAGVLIQGESGTGKELVAMAIHLNSPRRDAPFVPINCGSLPETLLESELFGHEEGAFTGAVRRKHGRIEAAAGGTLFLDEVAEMSPAAQVKLLRFLETKKLSRLGSTEQIAVDARVIAATNQPVNERVADGSFREDLFYRLNVLSISLPPLRSRQDDLPALVAHFLDQASGRRADITPEALEALRNYTWPGNVRELRNAIDHAVVASRGRAIAIEHLPDYIFGARGAAETASRLDKVVREFVRTRLLRARREGNVTYDQIIAELEKPLLEELMRFTNNNQAQASRLLSIHRTTLRKKLEDLGLRS